MLKKEMFQHKDEQERIDLLDANADEVLEDTYMKMFDNEQLTKKKDELVSSAIKIDKLEQKIRDFKAKIDEELKPLKDSRKSLLEQLKNGGEQVTEKVYKFIDLEAKEVGFYNKDGQLIKAPRPAFKSELSPTIQMNIREAANQ